MVFHALDIFKGYEAVLDTKSDDKELAQLHTRIQAIADMKLTYVVSCQEDEFHKRTGESRANDNISLSLILLLEVSSLASRANDDMTK